MVAVVSKMLLLPGRPPSRPSSAQPPVIRPAARHPLSPAVTRPGT
jgi:hypothetical protein